MYNTIDQKILCICKCEYCYFFNKANVLGVGLGYKLKNGFYTYSPCITVFVVKKVNKNGLCKKDLIPNYYKQIPTDIVEIGDISFSSFTKKIRPVLGGYSIGPSIAKISGTMGCLVTDGPNLYLLSNNHVLALINKAPIETPTLQPSIEDKGKFKGNIVANLSKFIPIVPSKNFDKENLTDCAIAKIISSKIVSSQIALVGYIKGINTVKLGLNTKKIGRTTEQTFGKVTNIGATLRLNINSQEYIFVNQICTTKMSINGDSGSILLDSNNFALGLLFASSNTASFFNPIKTVLNTLEVSLVTG